MAHRHGPQETRAEATEEDIRCSKQQHAQKTLDVAIWGSSADVLILAVVLIWGSSAMARGPDGLWNPHTLVAPPRPLRPGWALREWPPWVNQRTRAPGWETSAGATFGDRDMIRLHEIEAVNRAQRIISGRCWWRLSDAIVRRARRAWLINMSIDMRLTMPGLGRTRSRWAGTDIGPHHAEAAAYLEQERIALRWEYNSELEEI